ncbi:leukocyte-associated immunoglobulin-like receptor 2 isoform X2 [Equus caballus]|uniref:leukocyte-associated immunoglobulin-like receptor 2 isoform X2 n=1 Tax=Equus caballus TaxID=9796 RepID=UPI000717BE9F|nr:leukocyte-associated immunoglobulin-like receptor 2 isoform X3 [Equus caballus]
MWPLRASPAHFQPSQPQDKDRADGERLAMSPSLPILLGQVLCLGQVILTQEGALPRPSISAEPGAVILWGQPVTIVCRGPAEAETFRLAWEDGSNYTDQKILPQRPPHETEARFPITRVSDDTARHYYCRYHKNSSWSEHSEFLELVVTGGPDEIFPLPTEAGSQTVPTSWNYTVVNCVRMGLAGVVLLILVVILAEAWHSQHRSQHGPHGAHQTD